jgi:uncharacterized protein YodC (DUF2158 family)
MNTTFQPGDRVRQRLTNREMVVEGYDAEGRVSCFWFTGEATVSTTFLETDLERVQPTSPPPDRRIDRLPSLVAEVCARNRS